MILSGKDSRRTGQNQGAGYRHPKRLESLIEDMDAFKKEVYFVTDAQSTDWGGFSDPMFDAFRKLGNLATVFLVPVAGGRNNLAVTGLDLVSGALRNGSVARYRATVHNFGQSPVTDVDVRCLVEGVQIDSKSIPVISPGTSQTVSLFVPFYNAGPTRITAEIVNDTLAVDNVRHVVANVRDRVSVLCIDGSGGAVSPLVMAGLLARGDRGDRGQDEGYQVDTVNPSVPETTCCVVWSWPLQNHFEQERNCRPRSVGARRSGRRRSC